MNAFESARMVETRSMGVLIPFLEERAMQGRVVICLKGRLASAIQETMGDLIFNAQDGRVMSAECKADDTTCDTLALETFSNKNLEDPTNHAGRGSKPGWLITQGADVLLYHRLQFDEVLVIPLFRLKRWAFGHEGAPPNIYRYRELRQKKRHQLNDTWFRSVPIADVEKQVGLKRFPVRQLELWSDEGALA